MTVLKLSKSGKQLQVIDDFGNVYGIAVSAVFSLLNGNVSSGVSLCTRLPMRVDPSRFGVSPVWDPQGIGTTPLATPMLLDSDINLNNDALSRTTLKKRDDGKMFEDKEVW